MSVINSHDIPWEHYSQMRRLSSVSAGTTNTLTDSAIAISEFEFGAEVFFPEFAIPFILGMDIAAGIISLSGMFTPPNKRTKLITGSSPAWTLVGSAPSSPELPHKRVIGSNPSPTVIGSPPYLAYFRGCV